MGLLDTLIYLTKSSTLRKLSGEPKRLYKYSIVATFFNIVAGKHLQTGQFENIEIAKDIIRDPKNASENYSLPHFKKEVHYCLRLRHFHNPDSGETVDYLFSFFREKLEGLKKGKRFWKGSEFEKIISLDEFFKDTHARPIKEHHWIDFNIERGLIPTIPEFITYGDLINSWNLLLERWKKYQKLAEEHTGFISQLDFKKSEKGREIEYEIFTLQRTCYTACVTFVESYLFYLFYNFKSIKLFEEDNDISNLYKLNERNINDTNVIETIIIPKFITTEENNKKMKDLYNEFEHINNTRNSIIHTTAYEDKSKQKSFMELFFEINLDKVEKSMTNSIEIVLFIESLLPEEHKLLQWWDRFETPDFSLRRKISIVNPESNLSKLSSI
ncbi:hypothetical protein HHO41_04895 [Bacillus sp. DNRA2]|uniref:hypothetical protein n=1 Tax=Bacillus sp. DNRA2 TaxID=2723053 RepID=UPI00145D50A9|nr:hypothetical protein [Bacillus sp. DNRA2]NMD69617.1 hypothetical protein [Bacillus sp. DNRA2]